MKIGLELSSDSRELPWRETQVPGVAWIPLQLDEGLDEAAPAGRDGSKNPRGDGGRGGGTVLIRMEPGCGYPPHRHRGGEAVLVLEGSYSDEYGVHGTGQFVHYPAGSSHGPVAAGDPGRPAGADNPACVLYATAIDGIELLDPAERARSRPRE